MKRRCVADLLLPVIVACFIPVAMRAQPTLPTIAGAAENGVALLTWVCQYNGVKAIAVRRSADSMFNYKIVGYVANTGKGVQAFVDGHPLPGRNFYKLDIVFNSGLTWSSNHCKVYVDSAQLLIPAMPLPGNDSLQKFITTEKIVLSETAAVRNADSKLEKVSLSFPADSCNVRNAPVHPAPVVVRRKIKVEFPEMDMNDATFIKSKYILVSPFSGHVIMNMPADLKEHHYSIRFYNMQGRVILELPKIKAPALILDRRNFQRKGMYKFVLRRDGVEFESGYVRL